LADASPPRAPIGSGANIGFGTIKIINSNSYDYYY